MSSGSNYLTTYYAKRIIGDNAAADSASALLQTGENITTNTWLLEQTERGQNVYGIQYRYDNDGHDSISMHGGNASVATAWVQLDTGKVYILGNVGIGAEPDTHKLYVEGNAFFSDIITIHKNGEGSLVISDGTHYNDDTFRVVLDLNPTSGNHGIWSSGYMNNGTFTSNSQWMLIRGSDGKVQMNGNASTATIWETARTLTVGATGKSVDGSANVSWSMNEIMGSSDTTKFYRGDKTWSSRLTGELDAAYIGVTNTDSTKGYGVSLYNGATAGVPTYGIFFGGTGTFGKHGAVTSDWATYFTMNNNTARGWVFRRDTTNVASISGGGTCTLDGGLEIKGHIAGDSGTTGHGLYSGGAYHNAYNNIILQGDATTGSSGIAFVSSKGATSINQPSDRAFIQFHAYGVTTYTAENTAPTLATSGEANVLVIGVGNDATDTVRLQTPSRTGLLHQVAASAYVIPDTNNTTGSVGGTTTPVYIDGGIIKTCTAYASASVNYATSSGSCTGNAATATKLKDNASNTTASFWRGDNSWSNTLVGPLYINSSTDVGKDQNGALIIGNKTGSNIGIDDNEIMARNNGAVSTLYIQNEGGSVAIGANTTLTGHFYTGTAATYDIGQTSKEMRNLYARGYYLYGNSTSYGNFYLARVGTAGDGTNYGTYGRTILTLGNNIARSTTANTGANNARGELVIYNTDANASTITADCWNGGNHATFYFYGTTNSTAGSTGTSRIIIGNSTKKSEAKASSTGLLRIYGDEAAFHEIQPGAPDGNRYHYFPNATGWIATGGNGTSTGVGGADQIVYLSTGGVLTAGTSATNANTASTIVKRDASGNFSVGTITAVRLAVGGYNNTSYALSTNSFICNSWIRTKGSTGWYNEDYSGGWYMTDAKWVRTYNSKPVILDIGTNNTYGIGGHRLALAMVGGSHVSWIMKGGSVIYGFCVNGNGNWYFGKRTNDQSLESSSGDAYGYYGDNVSILPNGDNVKNLGNSSNRWKEVRAVNFYGALTGNVTGNCSGSSGSCTGNAATASKVGEATSWLYFNHSNEINFGGTNTSDAIYFGYRATDSRPKPNTYVFGTGTGTATVKAATFVGALTGNASTATNVAWSGVTDKPTFSPVLLGTLTSTTATNITSIAPYNFILFVMYAGGYAQSMMYPNLGNGTYYAMEFDYDTSNAIGCVVKQNSATQFQITSKARKFSQLRIYGVIG